MDKEPRQYNHEGGYATRAFGSRIRGLAASARKDDNRVFLYQGAIQPFGRRIAGGEIPDGVGAWIRVRPDTAGATVGRMDSNWSQIWRLADTLRFDILRIQAYDWSFRSSGTSRVTRRSGREQSSASWWSWSTRQAATSRLDSFAITASSRMYIRTIDSLFDLLLGSYTVRMRIDTTGFTPITTACNARYPVVELRYGAAIY